MKTKTYLVKNDSISGDGRTSRLTEVELTDVELSNRTELVIRDYSDKPSRPYDTITIVDYEDYIEVSVFDGSDIAYAKRTIAVGSDIETVFSAVRSLLSNAPDRKYDTNSNR